MFIIKKYPPLIFIILVMLCLLAPSAKCQISNNQLKIEFTLDFAKEINILKIPKSQPQSILSWQTTLLGSNLVLVFFDAVYQTTNDESLNISTATPTNMMVDSLQVSHLHNGDTRLHFIVSTVQPIAHKLLVQVSYKDKALLASVAALATYKKRYNNVNITTDKMARLLNEVDGKTQESDCFKAALSVDSYAGNAKWKPYFYDMLTGHSRFGSGFFDDEFFPDCPVPENRRMHFNMRFFIYKVNAG